jgi:hypothetical protein
MADTAYDTEWLDGYCGNVTEGADGTIASCMIYNVSLGYMAESIEKSSISELFD